MKKIVVAIDGPAAAGKSSVAKEISLRLGYSYVDSGAFYRAITWWVLHRHANPQSVKEVTAVVAQTRLQSGFQNDEAFLRIDGLDPTPHLRDDEVNRAVSSVSLIPAVRESLTSHLRELANLRNVVVEGRDIGSIVFPDTPFKFYIDASQQVRQQRRSSEGQEDNIAVRDRMDSSRPNAPLRIARDAFLIDSTNLTVAGVVGEIIQHLKARGLSIPAQ
jgi:cytidylate kinase